MIFGERYKKFLFGSLHKSLTGYLLPHTSISISPFHCGNFAMEITDFLLILAGGSVAGFIGALFGIGGGIFLIPYLVLLFHVPMHTAIATSIVSVIATSTSAASVYIDRRQTNIRLGMALEIATTAGALAGGITASLLPGYVLRRIFSGMLLLMGSLMWYRSRAHGDARVQWKPGKVLNGEFHDAATGEEVRYSVRRLPAAQLASLVAGNISGLLGVGGGIIKVPVMNVFSGVPMKAATATSNFMIGVTAVASAFIYFSEGHMNPVVTAVAVLGVLIGATAGIRVGKKVQSRTIIGLFVLFMFAVAVRMFFQ